VGYKQNSLNNSPEIYTITRDVIILSNTCDMVLNNQKLRNVLISPLISISEFEQKNQIHRSSDFKEAIRRGYIRNFFMLARIDFDNIKKETCLINFREIFFTPSEIIRNHAKQLGKRIRLKSPYRESLSQAFGKFIMYVGYPEEISYFTKKLKISKFENNF